MSKGNNEQTLGSQELFDQAVADGLDKNSIIKMFILDLDLDVDEAIREYNKMARDAGISLSNDEKKARQAAVLAEADLSTVEGVEAAQEALCKAIDIAPSTALDRIRVYAKENGIALAGAAERTSIATKEAVVAFLLANRGAERSVLSKGLVEMGYKKSTGDSIIAMVPYLEEYVKQSAGVAEEAA